MWTLVNTGFASGYSLSLVTWSGVDEWIGRMVASEDLLVKFRLPSGCSVIHDTRDSSSEEQTSTLV